jgi:hypothetical protein
MTVEPVMSQEDPEETDPKDDYLVGIEDGAGCTEIWEHLSRSRGEDGKTQTTEADDD